MHEVEDTGGAVDEAGNGAPPVHVFACIGHVARTDQVHHAVREHLGVDAEIVLVCQALEHRIGNRADAQLQRGGIGHQGRDMGTDGVLHGADRSGFMCDQRTIGGDDVGEARKRYDRVAVCARHPCVHLGNKQRRGLRRRECRIHRRPQRAITVDVGWRDLQQHRIKRDPAGRKQRRDVGEEHRNKVRAAFVDGPTQRRAGEQRDRSESSPMLGRRKRHRAFGVQVVDGDVLQVQPPRHRLQQRRRCRRRAMHKDAHARPQCGDSFVSCAGVVRTHGRH